jgi:hypothetical protein
MMMMQTFKLQRNVLELLVDRWNNLVEIKIVCSRPRISLKSIDGNGVKNCGRT